MLNVGQDIVRWWLHGWVSPEICGFDYENVIENQDQLEAAIEAAVEAAKVVH